MYTQHGSLTFYVTFSLQHPVFLLALLHAALEVDVEWGTASVIRDVSEMMTAAVTLLKYHVSQVQTLALSGRMGSFLFHVAKRDHDHSAVTIT